MNHYSGDSSPPGASSALDPLARELAQQVTRALARLGSDTPTPRRRDRRQDLLWDCASVLQAARVTPASEELVRALDALPALLEDPERDGFAADLEVWVAETSGLTRRTH